LFEAPGGRLIVRVPTLLLVSAEDRLLPSLAESARLLRLIPGAQRIVLPESGHTPLLEEQVCWQTDRSHDRWCTLWQDPALWQTDKSHGWAVAPLAAGSSLMAGNPSNTSCYPWVLFVDLGGAKRRLEQEQTDRQTRSRQTDLGGRQEAPGAEERWLDSPPL
jgi:hypothetical protein